MERLQNDFDPPITLVANAGRGLHRKPRVAVTLSVNTARNGAPLPERLRVSSRSLPRRREMVPRAAGRICIAVDIDDCSGPRNLCRNRADESTSLWQQFCRIELEENIADEVQIELSALAMHAHLFRKPFLEI